MKMQVRTILVFLGCFIRTSFQLACIQCTSPIQRAPQMWDHSCLDATLVPVSCDQSINQSKLPFKNCVSALYRLALKSNGGVHIHRGCSMIEDVRHECDPPAATIDFEQTLDFFCSRTCSNDGCNQHSVHEISSNANGYFNKTKILVIVHWIIWTRSFLLGIT